MPDDNPCTLTLENGTHYDLSSLASAKADYETIISGTSYKLNVCRGVVSEVWKLDDPDSTGGFAHRDSGDFSLGQVNTTLHISPSTHEPMLYLQNGSACPLNSGEYASTVIRFICSPEDFDAGKPTLVAALPPLDSGNPCHFFFEWKTHVACKTNPKAELKSHHLIGFGAFVFIILAWFIGHTAYNRFVLQKRGMDVFPIPRITRQLPSLMPTASAPSSSSKKPRWGIGRRSQRGYSNVRADDNDEGEGFAGRFSLEDDEDDVGGPSGGDARELGGDTEAWRGQRGQSSSNHDTQGNKPGAHQGLVDV
ncbi:mannose-6-phosphate receptor binding domain-containing protein [Kockovaella imperatae]|uniref:Mannose-6-phosphate receptor binding domain-containing protein n=1 Tax=Kockovaella imperatae TaxID=4999 RepID=A0A1Y1U6J4_9TREE|nr:mannose-6-phosphate receptor binding domain-containing protein [Kockovaella imperatae]ORX33663.1 mannose-6-phosphate receptor binding domain-containing protein [Kockovaella imperatae]